MIEFQKRKRVKNIIYSPVVLIVLVLVLAFLIRGSWNLRDKAIISKGNLEREKIELQKIVDRKNNLESSIEYLKTDQGVENEIRSKFRATREGEKLVVIVDEGSSTISTSTIIETQHGFLYRLFNWFVI